MLESLNLTDLVAQTACQDLPDRVIAAGAGKVSGYPTILTVIHPFAPLQRLHFVTLLIAIRAALMKTFPLICVYSNDAAPKLNAADPSAVSELTFTEITYLSTEMAKLSEKKLPQITVLTDANTSALSTRFPIGDLILAEAENAAARVPTEQSSLAASRIKTARLLDSPNGEAFVDRYISREALPETLGKLLGFFATARATSVESS